MQGSWVAHGQHAVNRNDDFCSSLGRASCQVSWRVGAIHLRAKHPVASLERVSDKESLGFELQLTDHSRNQSVSYIKMTHYLGNWEGIERDGASGNLEAEAKDEHAEGLLEVWKKIDML